METWWDLTALEHEHPLDQADDPRRRFQVAEIGFHRTDRQRRFPLATKRFCESDCLDGVAHRRARAVCFDEIHIRRRDTRIRTSVADQLCLSLSAWEGNPVRVAILIERRAEDHTLDRVAIGECLGKWFQQHDSRALAPHKAVSLRRERLALTVRREHARLGKSDKTVRRDDHCHAARHRHFAPPSPQRFTRQMHRRQRGRARRIHRQTRAAEVEAIGNPVRRDAVCAARRRVRADPFPVSAAALDVLIVVMGNPHEHTDVGTFFQVQHLPRVFNGLPSGF